MTKKELEVLDIFKKYIIKELKWFMYCDDVNVWHLVIGKPQNIELKNEEFEKLREWLEDG